jgi:hypothetical protein
MKDFNPEHFKVLIHSYGSKDGIITPDNWERLVCESMGATWIPGDTFMADGYKAKSGLNIKSITKQFNKLKSSQTLNVIQCRSPIENDFELSDDKLGKEIINTLVLKRNSSFSEFNLTEMIDVTVVHNRIENIYNAKIFFSKQPKYENYKYVWKGGCGFINDEKPWKFKRRYGNDSAYQTCLLIKNNYHDDNYAANVSVECSDEYEISVESAVIQYNQYKNAKVSKK